MLTEGKKSAGNFSLEKICQDVLKVARLGEFDHRDWWGTHSFGPAGRVVLQKRLPRTWRMAAVELDIKVATVRHNDVIDRINSVHLFSDNWPVRRWANAWVAEQKTAVSPNPLFVELETMDAVQLISGLPQPSGGYAVTGKAVCIGSIRSEELESTDVIQTAVNSLTAIYAGMLDGFFVPYLEVVS